MKRIAIIFFLAFLTGCTPDPDVYITKDHHIVLEVTDRGLRPDGRYCVLATNDQYGHIIVNIDIFYSVGDEIALTRVPSNK